MKQLEIVVKEEGRKRRFSYHQHSAGTHIIPAYVCMLTTGDSLGQPVEGPDSPMSGSGCGQPVEVPDSPMSGSGCGQPVEGPDSPMSGSGCGSKLFATHNSLYYQQEAVYTSLETRAYVNRRGPRRKGVNMAVSSFITVPHGSKPVSSGKGTHQ